MKVLWISGLPDEVRLKGTGKPISSVVTPAWSWILGHLPPEGVELHILCPVRGLIAKEQHFEYCGAQWHCFRQDRFEQTFLWRRFYWKVRSFVSRLSPDIVHGWGGESGCGYLATLLSSKAIVSVQGILRYYAVLEAKNGSPVRSGAVGRLLAWIEARTYRRAGSLLVESETSATALLKYYGRAATIVPHPLRDAFKKGVVSASPKKKGACILFVGSLVSRKGPLDAVQAVAGLQDPMVEFVIIGDGEQAKQIDEKIVSLGLERVVQCLPHASAEEISAEMARADIFLLPSYGDTGPTALKEALSQGCLPICYNNSGPIELVCRYGGKLAKTGDVGNLTEKLREALAEVRGGKWERAAVAERVREDLDKRTIWDKLMQAYSS